MNLSESHHRTGVMRNACVGHTCHELEGGRRRSCGCGTYILYYLVPGAITFRTSAVLVPRKCGWTGCWMDWMEDGDDRDIWDTIYICNYIYTYIYIHRRSKKKKKSTRIHNTTNTSRGRRRRCCWTARLIFCDISTYIYTYTYFAAVLE